MLKLSKLICALILIAPLLLAQENKPQQATSTISGTVVKAGSGEPVKKAQITLSPSVFNSGGDRTRAQEYPERNAVTDAAGAFEFANVAPGEYYLTAVRSGFRRQSDQDYGSAQMLIVRPGEQIRNIVLKISPTSAIRGRVVDEDGEPMSDVAVRALRYVYFMRSKRLTQIGYSQTDDRGEYRIGDLRPGQYYVLASPESTVAPSGMRYMPNFYPDASSLEGASELQLRSGDEGEASFHLSPVKTVSIKGTILGGEEKSNISVALKPKAKNFDEDGRQGYARVGENGEFTIENVLPGAYVVSAFCYVMPKTSKAGKRDEPRFLTAEEEVKVGDGDVTGLRLTLAEMNIQLVEVSGQLNFKTPPQTSPEHLSIIAQAVQNNDDSDSYTGSGNASSISKTGGFTLRLRGGSSYFTLLVTNDRAFQSYYTNAVLLDGRDVTTTGFTPGVGKSKLEIVVGEDGALIEGTVLDSNGHPFPSAKIIAVPEDQYRDWYEDYGRAEADQNGHFSLPGMRPGEYRLYAWDIVEDGAYMDPAFTRMFDQKSVVVKAASNGKYEVKLNLNRESGAE